MSETKSLTLGAKIKALRVAKGLTQGELTRGEITPGLISQIESDRVAPSFRVITLLAEQLGVKPEELLGEVEIRNVQMQTLKEARELLALRNGADALPLLIRLKNTDVSYIHSMELDLEMAYAYELMGEIPKAVSLYAEVEQYAFSQEEHLLGMTCMNRQGELYMSLGKTSLALFCYKKALDFLNEMNVPALQSLCITRKNISICAYRLGNISQALAYAERAYRDLQGSNFMIELAEICHVLSVLHVEVEHTEQALQFATDAVSIYRSLGMDSQLVDAKMNQAIVLRELGDYEGALRLLPAVIADYYAQGRNAGLANAWNERATCELELGEYDDAMRSLERSLGLAERDSVEEAEANRIRGRLLATLAEPVEAVACYESALATFSARQFNVTSREALQALAELYTQLGETEKAFLCFERRSYLVAQIAQQKQVSSITA